MSPTAMDKSTSGNRVVSGIYRRIITPELRIHNEMNYVHPHLNPNLRTKTHGGVKGGGGTVRPPRKSNASNINSFARTGEQVMSKRQTEAVDMQGLHGYDGSDFNPTVRFQKAPLPAMPLNQRYSVPSSGTSRITPVSNKSLAIPSSNGILKTPGMGDLSQRGRLAAEEKALEQCRALKRTSNIISYRVDKSYYMSGTKIPVKNRYEVDMSELKALRGYMDSRASTAYSRGSSRRSAKFGNHYIYSRYLRSPDSAISGRLSALMQDEALPLSNEEKEKSETGADQVTNGIKEENTAKPDANKRTQSRISDIDSLEGLDIDNVTPLTPSCDTRGTSSASPTPGLSVGGVEGAESRPVSQMDVNGETEGLAVPNPRSRMNSGRLIKGTVGSVTTSQSNDEVFDDEDTNKEVEDGTEIESKAESGTEKHEDEETRGSEHGKVHKGAVGSVPTVDISFGDNIESAEIAKSGLTPSPSLNAMRHDSTSSGASSKKRMSGPLTIQGQNFKMGSTKGGSSSETKGTSSQSELLENMSVEDINKYSKLGEKLRKVGEKEKQQKENEKEVVDGDKIDQQKKVVIDPDRYKPKIGKRSVIMVTSNPHNKKSTCKVTDLFNDAGTKKENGKDGDDELTPSGEEQEQSSEEAQRMKYTFITEKQEEAFKRIFEDIDHDKNGRVTTTEIRHKMFANASKKDVNHLMQVFDLNKDKTVDVREFVTLCALNDKIRGFRTENDDMSLALDLEKMAQYITLFKEMFSMVDDDSDGKLHIDEVLAMVSTALEAEQDFDMGNVEEVLKYIDRDEFGYIDFVGFLAYIPFFMQLHKTVVESSLTLQDIDKARNRIMKKFTHAAEETEN